MKRLQKKMGEKRSKLWFNGQGAVNSAYLCSYLSFWMQGTFSKIRERTDREI
ncbi:hypothetical protein [Paenibacillus terreus]|uniref:hypothetical protein n=1 Tax=Paenibacillus terreus TaxID=1387834 RepID=UPI0035CCCC2D